MQNSETCLQIHKGTDADKILQLADAVEILSEQIETLKLELYYKNQELEEIKQELIYTNEELCIINELFFNNLAPLPINRGRELANDLLAS